MNQDSVSNLIKEKKVTLTGVEKKIAEYFAKDNFKCYSAKYIAHELFVSEASLSRFAQKLGFNGYRELIFWVKHEEKDKRNLDELTDNVMYNYKTIVDSMYKVVNVQQIIKIAKLLNRKKRVFVYGIGSSGLVAKEFYFRFVRLGLDVEALTDSNDIKMNASRIDSNSLVIGISISGKTSEIINGLKISKKRGASSILLSSSKNIEKFIFIDEIVSLVHMRNLSASYIMSPQIPALIMVDIIYMHYLNLDHSKKIEALKESFNRISYTFE